MPGGRQSRSEECSEVLIGASRYAGRYTRTKLAAIAVAAMAPGTPADEGLPAWIGDLRSEG